MLKAQNGKIVAVHFLEKIPSFTSYYISNVDNKMSSNIEKAIQDAAKKSIAERIGPKKDAEIVLLNGHAGRTISDYAEIIGVD